MAASSEGIWDYGVLVDALVCQRVDRGFSCADVDARAGFHKGFADRLEHWNSEGSYGRGIGPQSLGKWLQALGVVLVVIPVDKGRPTRPVGLPTQLSLDLIGGHMHHGPAFIRSTRFRAPSLAEFSWKEAA